ncbi:hypothetical protein MKW98_028631 [Papaver atlanticum]|uniref:Kinesin motor domain-containing protein n=1 Tax=Papaver atlanticum TaxID=357466 RepID=A0AAD4SBF0_9MAGN|nr:hypothetical protein MKW98_028631 [Papaver atlanticum]
MSVSCNIISELETIESCLHENSTHVKSFVATLDLGDLAGSERAAQTKTDGTRLKEGCHINRSLLTLMIVIRKIRWIDNFYLLIQYWRKVGSCTIPRFKAYTNIATFCWGILSNCKHMYHESRLESYGTITEHPLIC